MKLNHQEMWNYYQNQNHIAVAQPLSPRNNNSVFLSRSTMDRNGGMGRGRGQTGLSYEDKIRKALDLKPYLNYLKELFAQNASDSDSSDAEAEGQPIVMQPNLQPKVEDAKYPAISQAIHTLNLNLNENSSSSSKSMFKLEPIENAPQVTAPVPSTSSGTALPAPSPFSSSYSDYSSSLLGFTSSDSSDDEDEGDEDQKDTELTPISDLELNKFLDKPAQGFDSPEDILSLLNSSEDCKSKFKKKIKKRKPKLSMGALLPSPPELSKAFESPSKRKQSLKTVRSEESLPSAVGVVSEFPSESSNVDPKEIQETVLRIKEEPGTSTLEHEDFRDCIRNTKNVDQTNLNLTAHLGLDEEDGDGETEINSECVDENDDDSLSEYMNITANSAISLDPYFKFDTDEMTSTAGSPASSVTGPSSASNLPPGCEDERSKGKDFSTECLVSKSKKVSPQKQAKLIEMMNSKRKRLYIHMCKKEIGKTQRARSNTHKEMLAIKRRQAQACSRYLRQQAIQSQKQMKESIWRAKRLTREMQAVWKQADRAEREVRKRRDREAEEQRKMDMELMEAKRQQRKLNFLITQTELYAHFMSKKLGHNLDLAKDEAVILNQLNDERVPRLAAMDDYDSEEMKLKAKEHVESAFKNHESQIQFQFDAKVYENLNELRLESDSGETGKAAQPQMFVGVLKHYQLRGMNWLVNLFNQGINGILADEMGLGKTVQSIAFLAHIAETYDVWGPFLVIAPASTLHNWQQEFERFLPDLVVVPYWGNPQERKILRQCWQQTGMHTRETSFHVVVTSYQIVVADLKYFNRIKWQYLILDEAQAIKSTTSARWKSLLGFNCRNRLLLTGTPIQNTMGELWALLHFIMPSLFDSHEEFSEWFSKDIESQAEHRGFIDEKHLCRLHMILKPFMLRRIKKDVENELSDKIEISLYCPLTSRQRNLYMAIKKKIRIDDLVKSSSNSPMAINETTNLMNLVMQFRKVCNHPDLFERREVQSPFYMRRATDLYPKLLFREGLLHLSLPSKLHLLENKLSIFSPAHTHESLFPRRKPSSVHVEDLGAGLSEFVGSEWSWMRFTGVSPSALNELVYGGLLGRWKHILQTYQLQEKLYRDRLWRGTDSTSVFLSYSDLLLDSDRYTSFPSINDSEILRNLVFLSLTSQIYALLDERIHSMPETPEHLILRSQKAFPGTEEYQEQELLPEFPHNPREPVTRRLVPTPVPSIVGQLCHKVCSAGREAHFYDQSAYSWLKSHQLCSTPQGLSCILNGEPEEPTRSHFSVDRVGGLNAVQRKDGWSGLFIPDKEKLISDSGKLGALDILLKKLKADGHRVLIYSQMTKMINILEEYMCHRKWTYIRLDGSSKISDRRDMVADFQSRSDIFVFLLSTRAGGLGINLTAADTVIFYDSDWNPTVDQQAMDRAHRVGQTKQVTVYRLICKGTIEERILQRAKEKNEIQRMVISGEGFRSDSLKPKEVVSLLLDDEELERKYRQKQAERRPGDDGRGTDPKMSPSKRKLSSPQKIQPKRPRHIELQQEPGSSMSSSLAGSRGCSPSQSEVMVLDDFGAEMMEGIGSGLEDDDMEISDTDYLTQDIDVVDSGPSTSCRMIDWAADTNVSDYEEGFCVIPKRPKLGRGTGKRGRPPSRVRVLTRESDEGARRRGRPRIKPIGPANQGIRGRRPGRPPLTKKPDSLSSSLTPLTTSQSIFGFYSSPDIDVDTT